MSSIVFDNVSKRFILHHQKVRSFQDLLVQTLRRNSNGSREEFWALRDVSFEIPQGQTVGVVGPNGAGKSTTLKLIARIFEPTSGRVRAKGVLNALIELGAGFHEDLTGRENIYLNASLRGLTRREIQSHFDEIVEFSGLEKFIDMQLRHYSSGMHVRLAFAVATCTHSDILLVDEVLAVGDAKFQLKCFDRIEEIRKQGTTIFLVSHSQALIEQLCERALLIMNGKLVADGTPAEVGIAYDKLDIRGKQSQSIFFAVKYIEPQVPPEMRVDARYNLSVTLCNQSTEVWRGQAHAGNGSVALSYRWRDEFGHLRQLFGPGTPLLHDLVPGETLSMQTPIVPPETPGEYWLEIDMVAEKRGWFSEAGCRGPRIPVRVLPPPSW